MMKSIVTFSALCLLLFSCKKEEEQPKSPTIAYKSVSTTEVNAFQNNVKIVFSYEDFQGDLGTSDPDELTLSVKDARLAEPDMYHIPPMTPNMEQLHIKGNYEVELSTLFLLGNGASETTKFSLQLRDRAGNLSNTIETDIITILP